MVGVYLTRLIGRERELAAVRERLLEPHVRLLILADGAERRHGG